MKSPRIRLAILLIGMSAGTFNASRAATLSSNHVLVITGRHQQCRAGWGRRVEHERPARDPARGGAPVYPRDYLRVNTTLEVVKAAGGHTAWIDKHLADEIVNGPSGQGVDDLFCLIWTPHELHPPSPDFPGGLDDGLRLR